METKSPLTCRTILSAVVLAAAPALRLMGYEFSDHELQMAVEGITLVGGFIGVVLGRIAARKKITLTGGAPAAALILAMLVVGGGLAGCTQAVRTTVRPMFDNTGKPLTDNSGKVLTETITTPVEDKFYEAQALPLWEFRAPQDKDVTFPAGSYMAVRSGRVSQYVPESTQNLREGKSMAPWAWGAWAVDRVERVATNGIAAAGSRSTTVNNVGAGSSASVGGGNGGQSSGGSVPTTTTTNTDDHSGEAQ